MRVLCLANAVPFRGTVWSQLQYQRLGVVTSRLCFQVLDGSLVADLARDLQANFRLRAKILRVSHALTPSFLLLLLRG